MQKNRNRINFFCINYLYSSYKKITKKNVMKSVFILFDISNLFIITETTIDRNLETDYVKGIFDKSNL